MISWMLFVTALLLLASAALQVYVAATNEKTSRRNHETARFLDALWGAPSRTVRGDAQDRVREIMNREANREAGEHP